MPLRPLVPASPRVRLGALVVVLAAAGAAAGVVFTRGGPGPVHRASPPTSPSPSAPPFLLPLASAKAIRAGRRAPGQAEVTAAVRATLSRLYQLGFLDPRTWRSGVPDETWSLFAGPARDRASRDRSALTLGDQAGRVRELHVDSASLSVRILFGPAGRPEAAVGTVSFRATATLEAGQTLGVSNRASFLLRPVGGRWLVVGYPQATTTLLGPAVSPSPAVTASPGASP